MIDLHHVDGGLQCVILPSEVFHRLSQVDVLLVPLANNIMQFEVLGMFCTNGAIQYALSSVRMSMFADQLLL